MPIYEYVCSHCHYQEDVLQKHSDAPLTQCPQCNEESFQKIVSAPSFQLKGTGWYVPDFRDKGKNTTGNETTSDSNTTKKETKESKATQTTTASKDNSSE